VRAEQKNGLVLISCAADFAAERHKDLRRKGAGGAPYVNHLAEVARLLAVATDGADAELVAAGWLHDTVEDTATSRDELASRFGEDVASLVMEVTDDKSLPKQERKRLQVEKTPKKTPRAKMIKLADLTSNLRQFPESWEKQRIHEYLEWATKVAAGCRGVNPQLERHFDQTIASGRAAL
jgi:GTP diphosphokinase / guanosine-3',5'-bis(diphosphate) 3'-diphosphatase